MTYLVRSEMHTASQTPGIIAMNATHKQSLVSALADFYMLAEELGSKTRFPDVSYFAKHPQLHTAYKNLIAKARDAGECDDSFIDDLAFDVSGELRRRRRHKRREAVMGFNGVFATGVA